MSDEIKFSSTPSLTEYDPREVPWQYELICDVRQGFDYSLGTHEILLSGTVGSGKSLPAAHIIATHVLANAGANFGIGRRTLPDLKDTLCKDLNDHLTGCGVRYRYISTTGDFFFENKSTISAHSWADGNFKKFGSQKFSGFAIEEAQENEIATMYEYIFTRIGRLPHIPEKLLLAMVNPDSPSHWIAKKFNVGNGKPHGTVDHVLPTRHAYYSNTESNKFLPRSYIQQLKADLDPKLARRLLYGEWIEIDRERIYHCYESSRNYKSQEKYTVDPRHPVRISFDFNIARGKPLSAVFFQYIKGVFHIFAEVVVEGLNTESNLEEAAHRGLFDFETNYIVHGDAAGKHGDTRSNKSDYAIIKSYLGRFKRKDGSSLQFEIDVPAANPSIRDRHNAVNSACLNSLGEIRLVVYMGCPVTDEGLRLTTLKDGAQYIEDDSKPYQHITTAVGYGVIASKKSENKQAPTNYVRKI
jgi:hypothetical protein